jgi:TolB-like protein
LERPAQAALPGAIIAGKYRILEEIGRGGMGVVYKAEDIKLDRPVALKFLPPQWTSEHEARGRFIHEARAASALDHPNICNIHEIGETEDRRMFIAMACYEGESLREKVRRGPLKSDEAIGIAVQVAQGMAKAHQKGIVHRDIKLANILITNDRVAKIVDFGLAKLAGQARLTKEGSTVGTVAYMSPEQVKGESVDQRTDIWSLGVVLYEMVAGRLPFKGDLEQSLVHSILTLDPEPASKIRKDLPKGLEQVILKSLMKSPSARYQSMDELAEDLKAIAEGLKPLRAGASLFRGSILGVKKAHAIAALGVFVVLSAIVLFFSLIKPAKIYDSIAVLPFENRSQNAVGQEALADDLAEQLIFRFHSVGSIRVPMLNNVADYRKSKKSYREIGREQNVKAVLYPTFQRTGDDIRVWATLLDASTGLPITTKELEKNMADIRFLSSELAQSIVSDLRAAVNADGRKGFAFSQKVNPRAYDAYLEYKKILKTYDSDPSLERWKSMLQNLQQATEIDPSFAPFYWSLVDVWRFGQAYSFVSYKEAIVGSEVAATKGLELDRESSDMHIAVGNLSFMKWDWEKAQKNWKRAVQLAPGDPMAHISLAAILQNLGFHDEAISEVKKAIQIDPSVDPAVGFLGSAYIFAGRYDEAIVALKEALRINPKSAWSQNIIAWAYGNPLRIKKNA